MSQVSLAQTMISSLLNERRHNAISPGQLAGIYQVLLDLFSLDEKARIQAIADMTRLREQAAKSVSDAQSVLEGLNFLPFDSIVQSRQLAKTTLTAGQIYYCTDEQKFLVLYDKGGGELDSRQPDGYNRNMKGRDDALFLCLEDRLLYQISLSDSTPPIATIHLYNSTADAGEAPFEIHRFDLYNPKVADLDQATVGTVAFSDTPVKGYFEIKTADGWQAHKAWNFTANRRDYPKPGLYAWNDILFWCRENVSSSGLTSQMCQLQTSEDTPPDIYLYLGDKVGLGVCDSLAMSGGIDICPDLKTIYGMLVGRPKTSSCLAAVSIEADDREGGTIPIAAVPVAFSRDGGGIYGEANFCYYGYVWLLFLSYSAIGDSVNYRISRISNTSDEIVNRISERIDESTEIVLKLPEEIDLGTDPLLKYPVFSDEKLTSGFEHIYSLLEKRSRQTQISNLSVIMTNPANPEGQDMEIARVPASILVEKPDENTKILTASAFFEYEDNVFHIDITATFGDDVTVYCFLERVTKTGEEVFTDARTKTEGMRQVYMSSNIDGVFGTDWEDFASQREYDAAQSLRPDKIVYMRKFKRFFFVGPNHSCRWPAHALKATGEKCSEAIYYNLGNKDSRDGSVLPQPGRIYVDTNSEKYYVGYLDQTDTDTLSKNERMRLREIDITKLFVADNI